jgi:hypothetical protein
MTDNHDDDDVHDPADEPGTPGSRWRRITAADVPGIARREAQASRARAEDIVRGYTWLGTEEGLQQKLDAIEEHAYQHYLQVLYTGIADAAGVQ